jgi:hypothetical protein
MHPYGFPVYIALICGADLSDIDDLHNKLAKGWKRLSRRKNFTIQNARNFFGNMNDKIIEHYGEKTEGAAVVAFFDKGVVSSLWGDFMVHAQCRLELYSLINTTTNV